MPPRSRIRRILEWKLLSPEYQFARPLYAYLDRLNCRLYPALQQLERMQDRFEALQKAQVRAGSNKRLWCYVFLLLVALGILVLGIYFFSSAVWGPRVPRPIALCLIIAPNLLGLALGFLIKHRINKDELRRELFIRSGAICSKCDYDLRGISSARCPECGTSLDRPAS